MTEATGLDEQVRRMRAALSPVVVLGPEFLSGRRDADEMAHTMVQAVQDYVSGQPARSAADAEADGRGGAAPSREAQELEAALVEIYTCGSGYLADRCDSACVARTMTQIVGEFGDVDRAG